VKKRIIVLILMIAVFALLLTACAPGDGTATASKPAGFFWGIWHGWIAPISLIVGLFNTNNTGWWYDFGFYIAIISGFGGLSLFRRKKSRQVYKENVRML
jgi:hypothetical protein